MAEKIAVDIGEIGKLLPCLAHAADTAVAAHIEAQISGAGYFFTIEDWLPMIEEAGGVVDKVGDMQRGALPVQMLGAIFRAILEQEQMRQVVGMRKGDGKDPVAALAA